MRCTYPLNLLYRPRVITLVPAAPRSACPKTRASRLNHQIGLSRGVADREIVTAGGERAAVAGLTHLLGLGSGRAVIQVIYNTVGAGNSFQVYQQAAAAFREVCSPPACERGSASTLLFLILFTTIPSPSHTHSHTLTIHHLCITSLASDAASFGSQ